MSDEIINIKALLLKTNDVKTDFIKKQYAYLNDNIKENKYLIYDKYILKNPTLKPDTRGGWILESECFIHIDSNSIAIQSKKSECFSTHDKSMEKLNGIIFTNDVTEYINNIKQKLTTDF